MCQLYLGDSITRFVQEIEDLYKGNDNVLRQLLYEDISMTRTGYTNRRNIYNVLGGPILVVLYCTNVILKAIICRKSTKTVRIDSICCIRVFISLIMAIMERIKFQLYHITVISCYSNIYIAFDDYLLLFRYKGL